MRRAILAAFSATTGLQYALNFSMETDYPKMFATSALYPESPWSFMTPPNEAELGALRDCSPEHVPRRDMGDTVGRGDPLCLRALPGSLRPENEDVDRRYLRKPS